MKPLLNWQSQLGKDSGDYYMNKIYLIKNISPWMLDELIAFSKFTQFTTVLLRTPPSFYNEGLEALKDNDIVISIKPFKYNFLFRKLLFSFLFFVRNINKFIGGYSSVIGFKSILWFLRLDLNYFKPPLSIHAQFATQAPIIALMIKQFYKSNIKYFFTFHAYDIYFDNKWFSLIVNESENAFSPSQYNINYVAKKFKYLNTNKIKFSCPGVFQLENIEEQKAKKNGAFTLGLMSWFVEKKGIKYLLEAIKVISKENRIKLILAGDGPLKEDIIDYINDNDLNEFIKYIGRVKGHKKDEFFKSLDVFVLPAISLPNDKDNLPFVLMEAISYGLPLISTNVSGIPEICENNYNGFLIPEKDVNALVDSLYNLKDDQALKCRFSENSLALSMMYDIELNSEKKLKYLFWI